MFFSRSTLRMDGVGGSKLSGPVMSAMVWLRMWLAGCGSWVVVGDAVSGRSCSGDVCTWAARRSSRRAHSLSTRETSTSSVGIFSLVFGFGAWLEAEVGRCLSISLRIMCRGLQMDLEVIVAFELWALAQTEPVGLAARGRANQSARCRRTVIGTLSATL